MSVLTLPTMDQNCGLLIVLSVFVCPDEKSLFPQRIQRSFEPDEKVIWMRHDMFCECSKRGIYTGIDSGPPALSTIANFGDDEYICARTKKDVAIFKFDRCIDLSV
jgi:hypothetical protein